MTQQEHILVVDDDAAGRYFKSHLLLKAGHEVTEAVTGKAGLEFVLNQPFALVLLDVKLPDMSGLDLCREIKSAKPNILVLQTSAAFTSRQDRTAGLAGGADSYLIEPVDPAELLAIVEALLRRYRVEQNLREKQGILEDVIIDRGQQMSEIDTRLRSEIEKRAQAEELLRHAQKLDVLGQLTSGIAHDYNNVLTIIMGNLESLRRQLGASSRDQERLQGHADSAFYGTQRAISLTRQLVAFSQHQALDPKVLDVNAFIRNLSHLLRQVLGEKIEVSTRLSPDLWHICVDAGQLETAVLNLAVNARDAMPAGGKLVIATGNELSPVGHSFGDFILMSVTDTGRGMTKVVLKSVFEPFFTTKDVGHGTGLGLSQVHGFVTQTGGDVKIESSIGVGTVVRLYLPRYTGVLVAQGPANDALAHPTPRQSETCILVVEDDDSVRAHSTGILREMGYTVIEADSAKPALAVLDRTRR